MTKTTGWLKRAVLIAALLVTVIGAASAQNIADVPTSHWAYEAVRELVQKGYLTLENGRFDGDRPVDRFTLATVVARVLHEVETGAVTPRSEEDVALLRSVVNEFREELVRLFAEINATSGRVDQNARQINILEGEMSALHGSIPEMIGDLSRQLERRIADLDAAYKAALDEQGGEHAAALAELDAAYRALLEQTASEIRAELARLQQAIESESRSRDALRAEVLGLIDSLRQEASNRITQNEEQIAETQRRVELLEGVLSSQLEQQGLELGELEGRLARATSTIESELERLRNALQNEIAQQIERERQRLTELARSVEIDLAELQSEVNAQSEGLLAHSFMLEQQRAALEELRALLDEQRVALDQQRATFEQQLAAVRARTVELGEQVAGLDAALARQVEASAQADREMLQSIESVSRTVDALKAEAGALFAPLSERMAAAEQLLAATEARIAQTEAWIAEAERLIAEAESRAAGAESKMAAIEGRVEGVERQVLAMQSQLGLSEEQLRALADRLMVELETQFNSSILLAQSLEQELNNLRREFNSYRQSTEQSLARANQAQLMGIVGAVLGLIGLFAN